MRILVVGDSLAFSRAHKGQALAASWPALLQARFPGAWVWQRAKGGATSDDVVAELRALTQYFKGEVAFDYLVVQVGIVDCCPRLVPRRAWSLIGRLPFGRAAEKALRAREAKLLRYHSRPWVTPERFAQNLRSILVLGADLARTVVFVHIAPACHYLVENAYGVEAQVARYNEVLTAIGAAAGAGNPIDVIDPWGDGADCRDLVLPDGHHLTETGHLRVFEELVRVIERREERPE